MNFLASELLDFAISIAIMAIVGWVGFVLFGLLGAVVGAVLIGMIINF